MIASSVKMFSISNVMQHKIAMNKYHSRNDDANLRSGALAKLLGKQPNSVPVLILDKSSLTHKYSMF